MKLVQMPRELLHLERDDLPALGVERGLLAGFEAYLSRAADDRVGLAILAPPEAGARELLMVLARRVGAALRNQNIRLRDHGGDRQAGYKKLCYLPGSALPQALRTPRARRSLEGEAACFFQDLEMAWADGAAALDPSVFLELLDLRLARRLPSYASAAPGALPAGLEGELRARLPVLEANRRGGLVR
jgi:hypothetical protein